MRLIVPRGLVDSMAAAGASCIYPSMQAMLGGSVANATGFVVDVALMEATVAGGSFAGSKIVAASYRWEGVEQRLVAQDSRLVTMPSNNEWFVRYVVQQQVLGWIDYTAHDFGDPALLPGVIESMGKIYSTFNVVPQYLLDPTKTAAAMKRGWIFQESAFTTIETPVLDQYADNVAAALDWPRSGALPDCVADREELARVIEGFLAFFERRCESLLILHHRCIIQCCENIRAGRDHTECASGMFFTSIPYRLQCLRATAGRPRKFSVAGAGPRVVQKSVLEAFAGLDFTVEEDCVVGILAQIAHQHFGETLRQGDVAAGQGLLKFMWEELLKDGRTVPFLLGVKRTMPAMVTCGLGVLHLHQDRDRARVDRWVHRVKVWAGKLEQVRSASVARNDDATSTQEVIEKWKAENPSHEDHPGELVANVCTARLEPFPRKPEGDDSGGVYSGHSSEVLTSPIPPNLPRAAPSTTDDLIAVADNREAVPAQKHDVDALLAQLQAEISDEDGVDDGWSSDEANRTSEQEPISRIAVQLVGDPTANRVYHLWVRAITDASTDDSNDCTKANRDSTHQFGASLGR